LAWPRREGGGNTRSGVADALHRPAGCLRQAVSLRSAVPPEQRRSSQKDTQPYGREQERPSGRVARSVTVRCGDAPSRAPCHTAFLALVRRFLIFSQVLRFKILFVMLARGHPPRAQFKGSSVPAAWSRMACHR
jgi:hypothetical protein